MPPVTFRHPAAPNQSLTINTGADQFVWDYELNLQTYPTYGGEITQILSAMIGDLTIAGTTGKYSNLEEIYQWFLTVLNAVTEGVRGSSGPTGEAANTSFAEPLTVEYPERGWSFTGYPKSLPGYKINRDDSAATWQIVIAVQESDQSVEQMIVDEAQMKALANNFKYIDRFGKMSGNVGFRFDNPFISIGTAFGADFNPAQKDAFTKLYGPLADFFRDKILQPYSQGQLQGLDVNWGSKPVAPPPPGTAPGAGGDAEPPPPGTAPPDPHGGSPPPANTSPSPTGHEQGTQPGTPGQSGVDIFNFLKNLF